MRKDQWNNPRIEYWQAIYEKLAEKFKVKGIKIRKIKKGKDKTSEAIGKSLRQERIKKKITQQELAGQAGITQQMLSKIEGGTENLSLATIKKIADKLGVKVSIDLK